MKSKNQDHAHGSLLHPALLKAITLPTPHYSGTSHSPNTPFFVKPLTLPPPILPGKNNNNKVSQLIDGWGTGRGAGRDRAFRMFSVIQDQQSRELSQGHVSRRAKRLRVEARDLKLAPVTCLAARQACPPTLPSRTSPVRASGGAILLFVSWS